jgi:hypothetical protein
MKLAVVLCLLAVLLALNWGRLPFGNTASPIDVQRQIFDNVKRDFR